MLKVLVGSSSPDLLALCLLSTFFIGISRNIVQKQPDLRRRILANRLWQLQFLLHPIIVFLLVLRASTNINQYPDISASGPAVFPLVLLSPFVFNFAVEPWNQPPDLQFKIAFYAHHIAPLLACCGSLLPAELAPSARRTSEGSDDSFGSLGLLGAWQRFSFAQAAMFAHLWLLHPMDDLNRRKIIDKQRWFWPYMLQGVFVFGWFWWEVVGVIGAMVPRQGEAAGSEQTISANLLLLILPVFVQLLGRWWLYWRVMCLLGSFKPGDPNYDAFETRRLTVESVLWLASGFLALSVRGRIFRT